MELKEIILLYLKHLRSSEQEKLLSLFAEDAVIHSPAYGKMDAIKHYEQFFEETEKSMVKVINIYEISDVFSAAANYTYKWLKKDGSKQTFDTVSIFNFDKYMKIEELKIIYNSNTV